MAQSENNIRSPKTAQIVRRKNDSVGILLIGEVVDGVAVTEMTELMLDLDAACTQMKTYFAAPIPFAPVEFELLPEQSELAIEGSGKPNKLWVECFIASDRDEVFHTAMLRAAFPLLSKRYRIQIGDATDEQGLIERPQLIS